VKFLIQRGAYVQKGDQNPEEPKNCFAFADICVVSVYSTPAGMEGPPDADGIGGGPLHSSQVTRVRVVGRAKPLVHPVHGGHAPQPEVCDSAWWFARLGCRRRAVRLCHPKPLEVAYGPTCRKEESTD